MPERPEKRNKNWRQQVEDFLQFFASSDIKSVPEFLNFLKPPPDDGKSRIDSSCYDTPLLDVDTSPMAIRESEVSTWINAEGAHKCSYYFTQAWHIHVVTLHIHVHTCGS